ncbi:mucolipin-3-like [Oppia nitens]|uniref:mucolipin-3-like n=1 Tax=Oppia nitens TaxID=1686743 RepID=UPI0023DC9A55|nr:mucolipin-3-like [Oppia nitens]
MSENIMSINNNNLITVEDTDNDGHHHHRRRHQPLDANDRRLPTSDDNTNQENPILNATADVDADDQHRSDRRSSSPPPTTPTEATPHMKDRFRRRLKYYFMSPADKWRAKRRQPCKLVVQVLKIILVTIQLFVYGYDMSAHLAQESNSVIAFRELFLSNWDPVREVMAYPPAAGPFAVYTRQDFYASIDYAIAQYANITSASVGSFGYAINSTDRTGRNMSDILVRRQHYNKGEARPSDYYYEYDNQVFTDELAIGELFPPNDQRWSTEFSSLKYFDDHNRTVLFNRLLTLELLFPLRTIYINSMADYNRPKCYDLNVSIVYDNRQNDGQMLVELTTSRQRHLCNGNLADNNRSDGDWLVVRQVLNWSVIVFSSVSAVLCLRSLYTGQVLCWQTRRFFNRYLSRTLTLRELLDFVDLWIVLIIVNDILIISGSALKMRLESRVATAAGTVRYNTVSLLLGVGNLCVWTGLLRYLGFSHKYNILILTLRRAVPNVLRFMSCAFILYGGFTLCGWLVLGPYHLKFRTLSRASECLFSLMNGDDMFATFYITEPRGDLLIWWFSRIYLYMFVSLFIYVVLSLFIALIMDSYETIKDYYENGMPLNDLQKFIAECTDEPSSRAYTEDRHTTIADTLNCFDCCRRPSPSRNRHHNHSQHNTTNSYHSF